MRNNDSWVECTEDDFERAFLSIILQLDQPDPDGGRPPVLSGGSRFCLPEEEDSCLGQLYDPDRALHKKLANAEFTVIHDAGPEDAAFRPGARLTIDDLFNLLRYEFIALGSLFLHNQTNTEYRVVRVPGRRLSLARNREPGDGVTGRRGDGQTPRLAAKVKIIEKRRESRKKCPESAENRRDSAKTMRKRTRIKRDLMR